jgi:valyl-tRNA synthetase
MVKLPLTGRLVPIVADEYADPEQGSGAVKITPAHDFNDYQVGKRNKLDMINIFTDTAHLNDAVPKKYRGLERFVARKQIVADMEAEAGFAHAIEDKTIPCSPSATGRTVVIEPYLTDQWYVDAKTLAQPAIKPRGDWRNALRAGQLGQDVLRMDAEYRAVVREPPAVVGA